MLQLRGLSGDCSANPNDPVCRAFYGTDTKTYTNAILMPGLINPPTPSVTAPNPLAQFVQATAPGTLITTGGIKPWYLSWWGLGLVGLAGFGLWKYSRPRKPSSVTAPATVPSGGTAGLFGIPMNENGMSYYRWIKAAGVKGGGNQAHYAAWKRGEDPADHATSRR